MSKFNQSVDDSLVLLQNLEEENSINNYQSEILLREGETALQSLNLQPVLNTIDESRTKSKTGQHGSNKLNLSFKKSKNNESPPRMVKSNMQNKKNNNGH